MDIAYSTTKKRRIDAMESFLKRTKNYWELGLTCSECSEPVYWKSGSYNVAPHFSHFHKTSFSEKCSLRVDGESSVTGDDSYPDFSLLLKDIHKQLFGFIEDSKILGEVTTDLDPNLVLSEPEERVVNLLQINKIRISDLYDEVHEACQEESGCIENPLSLPKPYRSLLFGMDYEKYRNYLNTNKEIGREIAILISRRSNIIVLKNLSQKFTQIVLKDFPNKDPALNARTYILKSIARRDWQKVLRLSRDLDFSRR